LQLGCFPDMGHPKYKPGVRMITVRRYPYLILALQEVVWVFLATSERWEHACEYLEPQIFLIA
jgi:hypothetical protein